MAEYQYRCRACRHMFVTFTPDDVQPCPICRTPATRQYVFQVRNSMPEHFNYSVGSYVSNERQLRDAIKVTSEEQSIKSGIEHNYEYLSPSDMADPHAHGVTDEGLDTTERVRHVAY